MKTPDDTPRITPRIYDVLEFKKNDHGLRYCYLHKVAAFTSQDAEQAFLLALLESPRGPINQSSEFYIVNEQVGHHMHITSVNFHVTGTEVASDPHLPITDDEHRRWIEIQTRPYRSEGELVSPAFRMISLPVGAAVAVSEALSA